MPSRKVAITSLGCSRNDVDSSELAGRLTAHGWTLVEDASDADVAVVNTCGFIEQAKKDSIDALLEFADVRDGSQGSLQSVVAVGCLAERYGKQLAAELPEADAVLGFDSYDEMSDHLTSVLNGTIPQAHTPTDRRLLLPISPVDRHDSAVDSSSVSFDRVLGPEPWAPLKLASGCDRRCSFCAIPRFRGAFVSRRPEQIVAEAAWLGEQGVREVFLVSENTTSYGKDLGDVRALESLLPSLGELESIDRVRVSYLQPAEIRPGLVDVMVNTPKVASYFDLSFQHSSPNVLRRMRRFGSTDNFLQLLQTIRDIAPTAGVRSNVIVGFPGESEDDFSELLDFLGQARLDIVGVFGYSDEEDTEAITLDGHLDGDEVADRVSRASELVEHLVEDRALDRVGEQVTVLVESVDDDGVWGRAEHQGPEVDGQVHVMGISHAKVGDWITATVYDTDGIDLVASVTEGGAHFS